MHQTSWRVDDAHHGCQCCSDNSCFKAAPQSDLHCEGADHASGNFKHEQKEIKSQCEVVAHKSLTHTALWLLAPPSVWLLGRLHHIVCVCPSLHFPSHLRSCLSYSKCKMGVWHSTAGTKISADTTDLEVRGNLPQVLFTLQPLVLFFVILPQLLVARLCIPCQLGSSRCCQW